MNMYTKYRSILCPGGAFCLRGVYTLERDNILFTTPYPCPGGSFCSPGSGTVIGSGFCPPGFFCPPESERPTQTEPGTFTPAPGSVDPIACYPGFFTL